MDLQSIGRLKFTVILVSTGTSMAPSSGLVDSTEGRGLPDAAAGDAPALRTITKAAIVAILTKCLSIIVTRCRQRRSAQQRERKVYAGSVTTGLTVGVVEGS
jgi:hypothetical protein